MTTAPVIPAIKSFSVEVLISGGGKKTLRVVDAQAVESALKNIREYLTGFGDLKGDPGPAGPTGSPRTAAATVVEQTSFGLSASVGGDFTYARAGHSHGTPANPITAHEAAADPHPGYLTPAEGGAAYAPIGKGVTNGDSHDHNGGDGGQIDHASLANKGTNTHAQIDTHIGKLTSLAVYANNAAAVAGGLVAGDFYRNGADPDLVCVVH